MIACLALYCRSNGQMIFEKQTMGSRKVVVFAFFLQALLCLVEEASSVGVVSKTKPRLFKILDIVFPMRQPAHKFFQRRFTLVSESLLPAPFVIE